MWSLANPPPTVVTHPATGVSTNRAVLNGAVTSLGPDAAGVFFQWGATESYDQQTTVEIVPPGLDEVNVRATVEGLAPWTTYHFRLAGTNSGGVAYGEDQTFTTHPLFPGTVRFESYGLSTPEGISGIGIDLICEGGSEGIVSVEVALRSGTAQAGVDFSSATRQTGA